MGFLIAIAKWNVIGALLAAAGIFMFKKYRDESKDTGEPMTKHKTICVVAFVVGLLYLLMPLWLQLFGVSVSVPLT